MTAAFLVPRRSDRGPRDRLWRFTQKHWAQHLRSIPIVEGHDDGERPFNRSRAMNRARALTTADTLVILDADVLVNPEQVQATIEASRETGRFTIGYTTWAGLNREGTDRIVKGYRGAWEPHIEVRYTHSVSSLVAVPAALWDEVGGFDERFEGWGLEDSAFEVACNVLGGGTDRTDGFCWHLWHPRHEQLHGAKQLRANRVLYRGYTRARGSREAMLAALNKAKVAA